MCSIMAEADCNNIANIEGFNSIHDLGIMESDRNVDEMAKHMASHTMADGHVILGTAVIKHLQSLLFWV